MSGYAATLHVVVSHGKGETVLPRGLELQSESDAARALKSAGFALPDQDGGGAARLSSADVDAKSGRRQTTLDLPLVALPSGPGRHTLTLPPLPVAIARASSDVVTLCTKEHTIVVEDPTASTPDAKPRPNPPPRVQREEWVALERGLVWLVLGARRRIARGVAGAPLAAPPEAGAAAPSAAGAVGGRARAPRRDAPRRPPRDAALRRLLRSRQRRRARVPRRALRLRRARVDDRRDARGAAAPAAVRPAAARGRRLPAAVRPREVRDVDADARGVRARARRGRAHGARDDAGRGRAPAAPSVAPRAEVGP